MRPRVYWVPGKIRELAALACRVEATITACPALSELKCGLLELRKRELIPEKTTSWVTIYTSLAPIALLLKRPTRKSRVVNPNHRAAIQERNMESIWKDAPKNTHAVFEHLKGLARKMRVETYGEIAASIGEAEGREIAPVSLNYPLGFIRDRICRPRGLPWLNALAVNAST